MGVDRDSAPCPWFLRADSSILCQSVWRLLLMGSVIYRRRRDLRTDVQSDGWAWVFGPDDEIGIALDPKSFAIWSAARHCTAREVASRVGVSDYLASSALTVLSHGGLVSSEAPLPHPSSGSFPPPVGTGSVSVLVVHHHPQGDLDTSVASVLNQGYPFLAEIVVLAGFPTSYREHGVRVVRSEGAIPSDSLIEQVCELAGEAFLLLDSRVSLAPGALEEMVHTLELRDDIVAVAPRIMWDHWPRFVVEMGDWSKAKGASHDPYAGHLDVGQFPRWQEVPAISSWSGLINSKALQEIERWELDGTVTRLDDWCLQARLAGSCIAGAAYAIGYGPWRNPAHQFEGASWTMQAMGKGPSAAGSGEQLPEISVHYAQWPDGLAVPDAGEMLHEGRPALTIEAVRGLYSHFPLVAPLPIRRRVAFVGQESSRHRRMAQQLSSDCDVHWMSAREAKDDEAGLFCQAADLLITTADVLTRCSSLRKTDRPVLVDAQSPEALDGGLGTRNKELVRKQVETVERKTSWDWLDVVDGIVCASEEERLYWLGALAARDRLSPYFRSVHPDLRDFVMVVPNGVETIAPPPQPVLKGAHPGVDEGDKVFLWCGPLRAFDDPMTAIRAFEALRPSQERLKFLFAAFGDHEEDAEALQSSMQLVRDLGLTERVLFGRQIPRRLRDGYLCEADLAVALGKPVLQARLSGPVALPACIGAGLPMIVTDGHAGSELIQRYALGQVVPACDIEVVAQVLSTCLQSPRHAYSEAFAKARQALAWSHVMTPLTHFCQRPNYALDRLVEKLSLREAPTPPPAARSLWALLLKAWRLHQQQGLHATIAEVRQYVRWRVGV